MEANDFERLLSSGALPSVLLFEGEEEQRKQDAFRKLRKILLPEGMEQLNETLLENSDADALIAAAETLPFLADRRLIVVRDDPSLVGRAEADARLLDYLPRVPPTALLLFYCVGKPDGRKKLYSAVKKLNGVVTFSPLKGRQLTLFVTDAFRKAGKECDERTADYLIFLSGSDTGQLLSEIEKISSFAPDRPAVLPDDVTALAARSAESTVFQMVDAVVAGQSSRAFTLLHEQLSAGADRMSVLALLLRQYRFLQHIKIMQYEKKSRDQIKSALGLHPFVADQYLRQSSAYTGGQVKKAVTLCSDTEYGIKSGTLPLEGSLETLVMKLLAIRQKD